MHWLNKLIFSIWYGIKGTESYKEYKLITAFVVEYGLARINQ